MDNLLMDLSTAQSSAAGMHASVAQTGKVHLGSGAYLFEGWTNIDLDPLPGGFIQDLTKTLPMDDKSVQFMFSEHFIEHITRPQLVALMRECRRVIRDHGVVRLSTPNLRAVIANYVLGRLDEWRDVDYIAETPCLLMNDAMRRWGHLFLYDEPELTRALLEAGFGRIEAKAYRESAYPELQGLEVRPYHNEIILEARP